MTARQVALTMLVVVPMAMNAVALAPEVLYPLPNVNDDAEHILMTTRASEALAAGENPLDMWVPQLELGFPQFLYYQQLPHLTVVAAHRLLLGLVPLRTVFDLVRYLLMITFPLTVFWSMRTMGFASTAAAVGAAASSLLSGNFRYGFEYDSYIWRGFGLFTQLFGMHLAFAALAMLDQLLRESRRVLLTSVTCAGLILGHLIYAYMIGIASAVLYVMSLRRQGAISRFKQLTIVGVIALALSAYLVVPFFTQAGYLNISPYLERSKYDSFGAQTILSWLVTGDLFDHGRFPVLTILFALGTIAAVLRRDRPTIRLIAVGAMLLLFYFGRPTLGPLVDLLPLHEGLLLHRFLGGFELAAIPVIGFGGGVLIDGLIKRVPVRSWGGPLVALLVLALFAPALTERWEFYALNRVWLEQTSAALHADSDAEAVLNRLASARPGRAYAGLRSNWGASMDFGLPFNSVRFYNLFADRGLDAVAPPYRSTSLNSDLMWDFNDQDLASYELFNVDYVVAPHAVPLPPAFAVLLDTQRYVLYAAPGGGYAQYVGIVSRRRFTSQADLFGAERDFVRRGDFNPESFTRFDYRGSGGREQSPMPISACARGQVLSERVRPARLDLTVECETLSALVLKVTYHPNWHVTIDGRETETYMVSPSYVGFDVPPGRHAVAADYRSPELKMILAWVGLVCLGALILVANRSRLLALGLVRRAGIGPRQFGNGALLEPGRAESTGAPDHEQKAWPGDPPRDAEKAYPGDDLEALSGVTNYYAAIRREFEKYLRGRVLEVGAGSGNFTKHLLELPSELVVLEPDTRLVEKLIRDFASPVSRPDRRAAVFCGRVEDLMVREPAVFSPGSFDTVVSVNVLEHIADDATTVRLLAQLIRPGGHLLTFVPALPFLFGAVDTAVGHHRRYLRAGLEALMEQAGLDVTKLRYFDLPGVGPWWVATKLLSSRRIGGRMAVSYDHLIVPIFAPLERMIAPPIGKNLLCVARRGPVTAAGAP